MELSIPKTMRAMVLEKPRTPLVEREVAVPKLIPKQLLIKVAACGVCRTDLHVVDGELKNPRLPLIPGHEVVGTVVAVGEGAPNELMGKRVGAIWLGFTCGKCKYCTTDKENLCEEALFNGYTMNGGYAEYMAVNYRYAFAIPDGYADAEAAPLMCAGIVGHRAYRKAGENKRLGLYGFGAAAHITIQVAHHEGREVFVFVREGDVEAAAFAKKMKADWVGWSNQLPPMPLDAAIIYAPAGELVPEALRAVGPGGRVICAGIHMSDIPSFPYNILWKERSVHSVANVTRKDALDFLRLASEFQIKTSVREFPLEQANEALSLLRAGKLAGAAVLTIE